MRKFLFVIFSIGTVLSALVYLLSCLSSYISPRFFWPMSFLALGFPYLAAGMIFLVIVWVFVRKRTCLHLLIILLAGYPNFSVTTGIHFFTTPVKRPPGTLRILTWNVRGFDNPSTYIDTPGSVRQQMFDYIRDSAPDIICMQEFIEHMGKGMISNSTELLDMGYNYFYRTDEIGHQYPFGYVASGTALFSRLPILKSGKVMYSDSSFPENIAFIDVIMQHKPMRIFSTHFKSLNLGATMPDINNKARFYGDSTFIYTASKFEKLKIFPQDHVLESRIAKRLINQSPYPVIFCGDLNTVPASYPYQVVSHGLQDAFLQRGHGLGNTMDSLPKTLRIDYLFVDKRIAIRNYAKNDLHLSDHFPQMIDISWK